LYQVAFISEAGSYILPMNPYKFPVRHRADHTIFNILESGEAISPGLPRLKEYELESSFTPAEGDRAVAFFVEALASLKPLRMILSRDQFEPENVAVVITSFEHEERGGHVVGEIHYKLTLREFRPIQARVL